MTDKTNETDNQEAPEPHNYTKNPPVAEYGVNEHGQPVQILFRDETNGDVLVTATLVWVISTLPEDFDKPLEHGCEQRYFTKTPHQGEALTLAGYEYYKTASMLSWSTGALERLIARRKAHLSVVAPEDRLLQAIFTNGKEGTPAGDGGGYQKDDDDSDGDVS